MKNTEIKIQSDSAVTSKIKNPVSNFLTKGDHYKIAESLPSVKIDWLTGGGEISDLIRAKDWSKTPLGSIEDWPQS